MLGRQAWASSFLRTQPALWAPSSTHGGSHSGLPCRKGEGLFGDRGGFLSQSLLPQQYLWVSYAVAQLQFQQPGMGANARFSLCSAALPPEPAAPGPACFILLPLDPVPHFQKLLSQTEVPPSCPSPCCCRAYSRIQVGLPTQQSSCWPSLGHWDSKHSRGGHRLCALS